MMAQKTRTAEHANRPMPTAWSTRFRGIMETALDAESSVSLACHLHHVFTRSINWSGLVETLADRGFYLQFEGTRLVLVNSQTGVSLCTCASLGHGFSGLTERFGKPCVLAERGRLIPQPKLP